jgi:mannose-6-phosphate isomerase-like protein (cupin superfamily)
MDKKKLVFNVRDVVGFSPAHYEDAFVSRMLVDQESVGSERLVMNYFVLMPGKGTDPGSHPKPFDEIYYILRGQGILYLNESHDPHNLTPDTVSFIPGGTVHFVVNTGTVDLEMITVMPGPLIEGVNTLYDERKKRWGTSFKFMEQGKTE